MEYPASLMLCSRICLPYKYSFLHTVLADCPTCLARGMTRQMFENNVQRVVQANSGNIEIEGGDEDLYETLLLTYSPWPFIDDGTLNKIALAHVSILHKRI